MTVNINYSTVTHKMIKGLQETSVETDQKHSGKLETASSLGTPALGVWSSPAASSPLLIYSFIYYCLKKSSLTSS